jgi:hypothetical protein
MRASQAYAAFFRPLEQKMTVISFGDNVRVKRSELTDKIGVSGKVGCVYGITTPSVTGIEFIGETTDNRAFNVHFEDTNKQIWFAPNLLDFVDHAPGTKITMGRLTSTRNADGSWHEVRRPWWKFWS